MSAELSNEQIYKAAPSVFAAEPWHQVSDRYQFVSTLQVVEKLRAEGLVPVKAQQSRTRIPGKSDFTKHLLRFRRSGDINAAVGDFIPEIVLINSHDRTSSYQLMAGIFRVVCNNGLVAGDTFDSVKVQHSGSVLNAMIEGTCRIIEEFPQLGDTVKELQSVQLSPRQQVAYAKAALDLSESSIKLTPDQILRPRRWADNSSDLWTTLNRVQENMVRGGLRGAAPNGRRIRTREVASVDGSVRLNKALWTLAEEMAVLLGGDTLGSA